MLFTDFKDRLGTIPYFMVLGDVFTEEECLNIINIGSSNNLEESKIVGQERNPEANVKIKIRQSKNSFIIPNENTGWIFEKLFDATTFINDRYFHFELKGFNSIQYTEYSNSGDYYDWHMDAILKGPEPHYPAEEGRSRKLSGSVILTKNTDYTGGELYIERTHHNEPVFSVEQQIGSIVFFPSFVAHKVNPVKSGMRKSLVFWVQGPKFR